MTQIIVCDIVLGMKAYTIDLRERIVGFVKAGGARTEAAIRFGVSRRTVHRYLEADADGRLAPKRSWGRWRKLDPGKVRQEVGRRPDATLPELAKVFGACPMGVCHCLRRLKVTLKKLVRYREGDKVQKWLFGRELEERPGRSVPVYFLGECGIGHRLYNPYARAPRGEKVYAEVSGARRGRTSIISASRDRRLVSPMVFDGYCDRSMVDACFAQVLPPSIPGGRCRFGQREFSPAASHAGARGGRRVFPAVPANLFTRP